MGSRGGRGAPNCSDVLAAVFLRVVAFLAAGFLRAAVFLRVVAFLAAGFLRAAVFLRVVAFLAAGFLRAAVFLRVVAFLAAGFLRAAVFLRVVAFLAAGFLRAAVFLRVVAFLAAGFLRAAVFLRVVAFLAAGFLRAAGLRTATVVFRAAALLARCALGLAPSRRHCYHLPYRGHQPIHTIEAVRCPERGRIGASLCRYALPTAQLRWVVAFLRGIGRPWRESTNEITNGIESTRAIW